jgi:hypothetical protein
VSISDAREPLIDEARWRRFKDDWHVQQRVSGVVYATKRFGMFIDMGIVVPGLLEFIDAGDYDLEFDLYDSIGQTVEAVISGFIGFKVHEVKLSARPEHLARATTLVEIPEDLRGSPTLFQGSIFRP